MDDETECSCPAGVVVLFPATMLYLYFRAPRAAMILWEKVGCCDYTGILGFQHFPLRHLVALHWSDADRYDRLLWRIWVKKQLVLTWTDVVDWVDQLPGLLVFLKSSVGHKAITFRLCPAQNSQLPSIASGWEVFPGTSDIILQTTSGYVLARFVCFDSWDF